MSLTRLAIAPLVSLLVGISGAFVWLLLAEVAVAAIDRYAPGYYPGRYSWAIQYSTPEHNTPQKIGWGQIVYWSAVVGFCTTAAVTLIILLFRLGGAMSVVRAYVIVCLSGIAGAAVGGGVGALIGSYLPGYYRAVFRAGAEPWFDPVQVGTGLGISQGIPVGLVIGAVVVLATTWYRSRARTTDSTAHPNNPA